VYGEGNEPTRQRLKGRIWIDPATKRLSSLSLDSERTVRKTMLRDVATVDYAPSSFGLLLPLRIRHQQFAGTELHVTDVFEYSGWRETLPASRAR
jgi:hypothetical protein